MKSSIFRKPRRELAKEVTPSKAGHLLSKYMHDEDNKFGLRVTNERGTLTSGLLMLTACC